VVIGQLLRALPVEKAPSGERRAWLAECAGMKAQWKHFLASRQSARG